MITKLKELMSLNAEMSAAEIKSRFTQIAKLLFENFAIKKEDKIYLFKEIEFYFYNKNHRDIITYPRICDTICWHINKFGGIDLNFPSKIHTKEVTKNAGKKVKKYVLDDSSYFGGILIRQLISEDRKETLSGPLACAALFNGHVNMENDDETPKLFEHENKPVPYYDEKLRKGILASGITDEEVKKKYLPFLTISVNIHQRRTCVMSFFPSRIKNMDMFFMISYCMTVRPMRFIFHPG